MSRFARTSAMLVATSLALVACSGGAAQEPGDGPIVLEYETLVWQPGAVAANQEIVDAWNAANPDVQVKIIEGSWEAMHDKLTTGFEAGSTPDVFHYTPALSMQFAEQGYLLDLGPYITPEQRADIAEGVWESVQLPGQDGVYGVPFLQAIDVMYANTAILEEAGIDLPTVESPWTWDDYRKIAKQLTVDSNGDGKPEVWGAGVALTGAAFRVQRWAFGNGGTFYEEDADGEHSVVFGEAEQMIPRVIHDMIHVDKTIDPENIGSSTEGMLPAFFAGKLATFISEGWLRDQLRDGAPEGFEWALLPPLFSQSFAQPSENQALHVSASTEHPEEAAAFVRFFTNAENQIKMSLGDGLVATSIEALHSPELTTTEHGWDVISAVGTELVAAPYQSVPGNVEWRDRVADAAFDAYFRDEIDMAELERLLVEDGGAVIRQAAR